MSRASRRILVSLLLALGLLGLVEQALRPYVAPAASLPLPLSQGMPHAEPPRRPWPGVLFTRSGQPVVGAPDPSTLRILVLGGSSAYGYGVTRFRSYPGILQARMDDSGRPVEVVNASFAALDLLDCLEILKTALKDLRPGLVLCALGNNEMLRVQLYVRANPRWSPSVEGIRRALEPLALYRLLAAGLRPLPRSEGPTAGPTAACLGPDHAALVRPILRQTLEEVVARCRQAGVPLVLLVDPCDESWPPHVDPAWPPGTPNRRAWEEYAAGLDLLERGQRARALAHLDRALELDPQPKRCLPSFSRLIREVASASGIPVLEGKEALRRQSPTGLADQRWFYDNCHLVPPGNQAFADLVEAFLDRQGLLPPAGRSSGPPDPADLERVDLLDEDRVLPPHLENSLRPPPDWRSPRFSWTRYQYQRRLAAPESLDGRVARGHLAFSSQDYPQAVAWYRRALELDAERAVLWRNLGHALLGAGRDPEAAEAYRTFLRQGGRDPRLARLVKIQPGRPPRPGPEDAAPQARGPSTRR